MEANSRHILSGSFFSHLIPSALLQTIPVKKGANLSDTLKVIPQVVHGTLHHTKRLASTFKTNSIQGTCGKIWRFVYQHINYKKDRSGYEQIRTPSRVWHDRFDGVDCDCYSVFISSILTNLKIPHSLRVTKYTKPYFEHIYPIVHLEDGSHITLDCVVDYYNYEVPFTHKKDITMELEILNGFDDNLYDLDIVESTDFDLDSDLQGLFSKNKKGGGKIKQILGKGLNAINRVNPATLALRAGFLASMKLNIFKVAQRVKWAYLSEAQAKKKGVDLGRWRKLVEIKNKMEKLYYGAGGKTENLKKAILTGKGNKNKVVAYLNGFSLDGTEDYLSESMMLSDVIGQDMYSEEFSPDSFELNGLGQLGEPISATTIAAASGAVAAFAALIKNVGTIFPRKAGAGTKDFEFSADEIPKDVKVPTNLDDLTKTQSFTPTSREQSSSVARYSETDEASEQLSFWEKNKKWLKPTLIGVGSLGALYAGFKIVKSMKKQSPSKSLNGTPKSATKSKSTTRSKRTIRTKKPKNLM